QKRSNPDVDSKAALNHAGDTAGDDLLVVESAGQFINVSGARAANARKFCHPLIIEAGDGDVEGVADLNSAVALAVPKIPDVYDAFGFRAVVNQDGIAGYPDNCSLKPWCSGTLAPALTAGWSFAGRFRGRLVGTLKFVKDIGERLVLRRLVLF